MHTIHDVGALADAPGLVRVRGRWWVNIAYLANQSVESRFVLITVGSSKVSSFEIRLPRGGIG